MRLYFFALILLGSYSFMYGMFSWGTQSASQKKADQLLEEVRAFGSPEEKKIALDFIEKSGNFWFERSRNENFVKTIEALRFKDRKKDDSLALKAKIESVKKAEEQFYEIFDKGGPEHVSTAFCLASQIRSFCEVNNIQDSMTVQEVCPHYTNETYPKLYVNITRWYEPRGVLSRVLEKYRGPLCVPMIHAVQRHCDIVSAAQERIEDREYLHAHPEALNTFLDLGVKPYYGWHVAWGRILTYNLERYCFEDGNLCQNLIAQGNLSSLSKIFTQHPSLANKNIFVRAMEACKIDRFAELDALAQVYDSLDLHYPDAPRLVCARHCGGVENRAWLLELFKWAKTHNYDLGYCVDGKTSLDVFIENMLHRGAWQETQATAQDVTRFLVSNNCNYWDPSTIVSLEERVNKLGKIGPEYAGLVSPQEQQEARSAGKFKELSEVLAILKEASRKEVVIDIASPMEAV